VYRKDKTFSLSNVGKPGTGFNPDDEPGDVLKNAGVVGDLSNGLQNGEMSEST